MLRVKLLREGIQLEVDAHSKDPNHPPLQNNRAQTLTWPNFNAAKHKLLWMQNGGETGIELDDIAVTATVS